MCLLQEVHRLQKEADEANKRASVMERDNQRCELQLVDMAQQVGFHLFSSSLKDNPCKKCISRFLKICIFFLFSILCLSSQVRVLLIELEEARGNHVIHEEELSSADVSSTSEVISQHLVTFRSVEELQKQNQRLLVALRELSDAQEKEEFEATGNKYVKMCADSHIFFLCEERHA